MAVEIMTNIEVKNIKIVAHNMLEVLAEVGIRDGHSEQPGSVAFTVPVPFSWDDTMDRTAANALEQITDTYGDLSLILPSYEDLNKRRGG